MVFLVFGVVFLVGSCLVVCFFGFVLGLVGLGFVVLCLCFGLVVCVFVFGGGWLVVCGVGGVCWLCCVLLLFLGGWGCFCRFVCGCFGCVLSGCVWVGVLGGVFVLGFGFVFWCLLCVLG